MLRVVVFGRAAGPDEEAMVRHVPVLLDEVVALLAPQRGGIFVDCTVGLGGHALELLERGPTIRLVGIDRDPRALALAAERLAPHSDRVLLLEGRFSELSTLVADQGIAAVDGLLADLGVSSMQLDEAARGFSFQRDGPLDMRMGDGGMNAADVVNGYSEEELARIFREHGEERQARRIARAIVRARATQPISTTAELQRVVAGAKGGGRPGRIDPATQVFQALRIEVNRELEELDALLEQSVNLLADDGRLAVISYHSLEDRRVKGTLRDLSRGEVDRVTGRPLAETQLLELLTRRPVRAGHDELQANPRARSAKLRAARRLERS